MRAVTARVLACALATLLPAPRADAADDGNPYRDPPPLRATHGIAACAAPKPRVLTPAEARAEAHQRAERGTSCWLEGKCEPGGDYRRDGEIASRVAAALHDDPRFADTSLWVETLRGFVTLKGCLARARQGAEAEARARAVDGVKLVWQEARVAPRR